ncbi:MAG: DUF1501 domain-containing protein, partial [Bacteroidia bacterium]
FDTHVGQLNRQDKLLQTYAEGLNAFIKNLKAVNKWNDSLVFTFSEFGRRVEENASGGTDHGTAGNVFLFGGQLKKKGIVNEVPDLLNLDEGDLKYHLDFRNIYANILENWLMADPYKLIGSSVVPYGIV